jgi:hypothetical protein
MPARAKLARSSRHHVLDVALAVEPALVESARDRLYDSGSSARSDRSSSSHLSCQTPRRLRERREELEHFARALPASASLAGHQDSAAPACARRA